MEPSDSIQQAAPVRSAERQALADAIARRGAAERALEDGRRTAARLGDVVGKAGRRLEAAHEALAAAGEGRAQELAAAADALRPAEAAAPAATRSTQAVRFALADAQDELDAATAARAKLAGRLADLEDELRAAGNHVIVAADAVLRAGAADLLADAEDMAARLRARRHLLRLMREPEVTGAETITWKTRVFGGEDWDSARHKLGADRADRRHYADMDAQRQRDEPFAALDAAIKWFLEREPFGSEQLWAREATVAPWQAARAAMLAGDADAPLPEMILSDGNETTPLKVRPGA